MGSRTGRQWWKAAHLIKGEERGCLLLQTSSVSWVALPSCGINAQGFLWGPGVEMCILGNNVEVFTSITDCFVSMYPFCGLQVFFLGRCG